MKKLEKWRRKIGKPEKWKTGGMGYTTFTIAGPTGEGLTSAKSFCRKRRCVLQDGLHIRMK